jgi:hypothetical protein
MSAFDIFTNLQFSILNMPIENQISLLNDCLTAINNIQKSEPKFKQVINSFLQKNACVLDNESIKLLKYELDTFKINSNNPLVQYIQSGGKKTKGGADGDEQSLVTTSNSLTNPVNPANPVINNTQNNVVVNPPLQPVNDVASIISSLCVTNLSPEDKAKLISQILTINQTSAEANKINAEANKINAQAQLASVDIQKNNDSFVRKVSLSGMFFSYTAPAAVVYFLNSTLNTVAIGTINLAGSVATTVTETAELTVRNAVPKIINTAISSGKAIKDYIPQNLYSFLQSTVSSVRSTGMAEYATDSYLGQKTAELTAVGTDVGTETIILGCLIFYIGLVLILSILTSLITNLQTNRKFKAFIGFPGVGGISLGYGGKKTRKNNKKRYHRKNNHKKTNKK